MSSAVLAVGAPSVPKQGFLRKAIASLSGGDSLVGKLADAEGAVFQKYDDVVKRKLGANSTSSELAMNFPRMVWRILAGIGTAAALGISLL